MNLTTFLSIFKAHFSPLHKSFFLSRQNIFSFILRQTKKFRIKKTYFISLSCNLKKITFVRGHFLPSVSFLCEENPALSYYLAWKKKYLIKKNTNLNWVSVEMENWKRGERAQRKGLGGEEDEINHKINCLWISQN